MVLCQICDSLVIYQITIVFTNYLLDKRLCMSVGTLRQGYPLLQDKDEGAQEWQPRTTGPDPRGQVPNLRGPDLGLYKWKPDLQEA